MFWPNMPNFIDEDSSEGAPEPELISPDASGNIVLDGYAPGAHVAIQLFGVPPEEPLAERALFLGACDESTTIRIDSEPRTLEGVVESADGTPISQALVKIARGRRCRTSSEGSFSLPHVFARTVSLEIEAFGYTPILRDRVAVDGTKQRFVLVRDPSWDESLLNSRSLNR